MMRGRLLTLCVLVLLALGAWVGLSVIPKRFPAGPSSREVLKNIGMAFHMYSAESEGEMYPPMGQNDDSFAPDMDAFGAYLAHFPLERAYLLSECGVDVLLPRLCH